VSVVDVGRRELRGGAHVSDDAGDRGVVDKPLRARDGLGLFTVVVALNDPDRIAGGELDPLEAHEAVRLL
jgi:hypothetical protein